MEDGLLSAEQFSTTTLRRVLEPSWKLLAAALLIALAFVLAAAGRPQGYARGGDRELLQRRIACFERDIPIRSRRFASAAQPPRTQTELVLGVI